MNSPFLLLPLAILCLWTPAAAITSSEVRNKLRKPIRRRDEGLASLVRCKLNSIDLIRGAFGAWLLQHEVLVYRAGQDDTSAVYTTALFAALLIAVLLQTVWIDRPVRIIGPLFFMAGVTLAVSGPLVGGFAVVLGVTCALLLRRLSLCFVFAPAGLIAFSLLFHKMGVLTLFNAAIFVLPALLAFGFGVRIAFVRRSTKSSGRSLHSGQPASSSPKLEPRDDEGLIPGIASARAKAAAQKAARPAPGPKVIDLSLSQVANQKRSA